MTLGHVYDLDPKKNEMLIKEVIIQAQGEVPLLPFILLAYANGGSDGTGRIHQAGEGDMD